MSGGKVEADVEVERGTELRHHPPRFDARDRRQRCAELMHRSRRGFLGSDTRAGLKPEHLAELRVAGGISIRGDRDELLRMRARPLRFALQERDPSFEELHSQLVAPPIRVNVAHEHACRLHRMRRSRDVVVGERIVAGIEHRIHLEVAKRRLPRAFERFRVARTRTRDVTEVAQDPRVEVDPKRRVPGQAPPSPFGGCALEDPERLTCASAGR